MSKIARELIKPVSENPLQAFYTNRFQLFDVIEIVLGQVGKCESLTMSSFSISEEFVRKIFKFREEYKINRVDLILDAKAAAKVSKLDFFLKKTFDTVYLGANHGKVVLFDAVMKASICTSQNLTRGNRNETHVITTDQHVYKSMIDSIEVIKQTAVKL